MCCVTENLKIDAPNRWIFVKGSRPCLPDLRYSAWIAPHTLAFRSPYHCVLDCREVVWRQVCWYQPYHYETTGDSVSRHVLWCLTPWAWCNGEYPSQKKHKMMPESAYLLIFAKFKIKFWPNSINLPTDVVSAVIKTKLRPRFIGSFTVVFKKGILYMPNLPRKLRIHPVFCVVLL